MDLLLGPPSDAVKEFHRQVLKKGMEALYTQNTEQRHVSTLILACDEHQIAEAKDWIDGFGEIFAYIPLVALQGQSQEVIQRYFDHFEQILETKCSDTRPTAFGIDIANGMIRGGIGSPCEYIVRRLSLAYIVIIAELLQERSLT